MLITAGTRKCSVDVKLGIIVNDHKMDCNFEGKILSEECECEL